VRRVPEHGCWHDLNWISRHPGKALFVVLTATGLTVSFALYGAWAALQGVRGVPCP